MPEISRFYGIVIQMHWDDHAPPHFHAVYGEYEVEVAIADRRVLDGAIPSRALGLVSRWAAAHERELIDDWDRAQARLPLLRIEPLR